MSGPDHSAMARIGDPRPSKHLEESTDYTYLRKQIIMYFQTKVLDCRFFFWNKFNAPLHHNVMTNRPNFSIKDCSLFPKSNVIHICSYATQEDWEISLQSPRSQFVCWLTLKDGILYTRLRRCTAVCVFSPTQFPLARTHSSDGGKQT